MKAFQVFIKLFEVAQRIVEIKISVNFLPSSEIETGRIDKSDRNLI